MSQDTSHGHEGADVAGTGTSVTTVERKAPAPIIRHLYPRTGRTHCSIGSVAYCGHIKDTPWSGKVWFGEVSPDRCVVCIELVTRGRQA